MFGLMYAWYMPKDEPSPGLGHVNDVCAALPSRFYLLTDCTSGKA